MFNWFALGCPEMKDILQVCITTVHINPFYFWMVVPKVWTSAIGFAITCNSLNIASKHFNSQVGQCLWHSFFVDYINLNLIYQNLSQHFMLEWFLYAINSAVSLIARFANGLIMFLTNRCDLFPASYSWMSHLRPGWKPWIERLYWNLKGKCSQIISQERNDRLQ